MDELTPEWLDADFLSDCLRNESKNQNIVVNDFQVESAVPPGNNFGSIVIRVKLNYTDKTSAETNIPKTLIIKLPLTQGVVKEMYGEIIDIEPIFYRDYLPKAYELLKRDFAPKYYPTSLTDIPVVVLEDLKEAGFVMANKKEKLDFDNCLRYAESAAAFHAGSVAVYKRHPGLVKRLGSEKLYSNEVKAAVSTKNMIRYSLECMADRVLQTTGDKRVSNIIKGCSTILWDLLVEAVKPSGPFNTINQSDPWPTNMMFKYDNKGNCVGIKILDFQALRYASPASDLVVFIWASAKHYVREERFDDFIQAYFEAMNRNLEEAKCDERLTLDLLKKELLRMSSMVLYICGLCLPLLQLSAAMDIEGIYKRCEEDYSPEDNPFDVYYTEDFCKNHLIRLVKQMEKQNVFDYLNQYLKNI